MDLVFIKNYIKDKDLFTDFYKVLLMIYEGCLLYFTWVVLHYVATHLYARMCTPLTIMGFIASPFLVPAPHCQGLRWLIYKGGEQILAMWVLFGAYLLTKIKNLCVETKKQEKED
tara:strand:+ start:2040 stop:2384 length:345 start_codon:yes stop_codon:yes gene_type:complete